MFEGGNEPDSYEGCQVLVCLGLIHSELSRSPQIDQRKTFAASSENVLILGISHMASSLLKDRNFRKKRNLFRKVALARECNGYFFT